MSHPGLCLLLCPEKTTGKTTDGVTGTTRYQSHAVIALLVSFSPSDHRSANRGYNCTNPQPDSFCEKTFGLSAYVIRKRSGCMPSINEFAQCFPDAGRTSKGNGHRKSGVSQDVFQRPIGTPQSPSDPARRKGHYQNRGHLGRKGGHEKINHLKLASQRPKLVFFCYIWALQITSRPTVRSSIRRILEPTMIARDSGSGYPCAYHDIRSLEADCV